MCAEHHYPFVTLTPFKKNRPTSGAQNLKQLERKIRALSKNTTLTFW
jgi:hypothetical protein